MVRINFSMLDILIVEDNLFEQSVMQTMLRAFGARQVRAARNGKLAIRSVLSRGPDIILLDREIGEPSGLDVARFIRLASKSPDNFLPMIMVTSHAEQCQIVEARDAGINAVIVKPFSPQTLYRHVLKVIAAPRQFVRTKIISAPIGGASPAFNMPVRNAAKPQRRAFRRRRNGTCSRLSRRQNGEVKSALYAALVCERDDFETNSKN